MSEVLGLIYYGHFWAYEDEPKNSLFLMWGHQK